MDYSNQHQAYWPQDPDANNYNWAVPPTHHIQHQQTPACEYQCDPRANQPSHLGYGQGFQSTPHQYQTHQWHQQENQTWGQGHLQGHLQQGHLQPVHVQQNYNYGATNHWQCHYYQQQGQWEATTQRTMAMDNATSDVHQPQYQQAQPRAETPAGEDDIISAMLDLAAAIQEE